MRGFIPLLKLDNICFHISCQQLLVTFLQNQMKPKFA